MIACFYLVVENFVSECFAVVFLVVFKGSFKVQKCLFVKHQLVDLSHASGFSLTIIHLFFVSMKTTFIF